MALAVRRTSPPRTSDHGHYLASVVIEDDELDRALIAELFCLRGRGRVVVTEAPTLKTGLDLVATFTFDLVLLDTKLPTPVRCTPCAR